jgi:hypothetical protein
MTASILINDQTGSFRSHSEYFIGGSVWSIDGGDLDNDGDIDLVTSNVDDGRLVVLFNDGSAGFDDYALYSIDGASNGVRCADLNNDEFLDLVNTNLDSNSVQVMLNHGDGSFGAYESFRVGAGPWSVYAADLDGDDDLDLANSNVTTHDVTVLVNDGLAGFDWRTDFIIFGHSRSIIAADLDGDADLDLAGVTQDDSAVVILWNERPPYVMAVIDSVWWSDPIDQDGDGYLRQAYLNWLTFYYDCWDPYYVYEEVYRRLCIAPDTSDTGWSLYSTTDPDIVADCFSTNSISVAVDDSALYDYRLLIYRQDDSLPGASYGPSDNSSLNCVALESFLQDSPSGGLCFVPVPATGKPYTVAVLGALLDGLDLPPGTDIGVFDDTLCVGSNVYTGEWPVTITAWESDPGNALPGFTAGNPIYFRYCIDDSTYTSVVIDSVQAGDGSFGSGVYTAVYLAYLPQIQLPLVSGRWDWISLWQEPVVGDADSLFGGLDCLAQAIDDEGRTYIPDLGINTIGDHDMLKGYAVFESCGETLSVITSGPIDPCDSQYTVEAYASGWNLIPYLLDNCVDILLLMSPLEEKVKQLLAVDGRTWIPELSINTLGELCPGEAYRVFFNPDTVGAAYSISYCSLPLLVQVQGSSYGEKVAAVDSLAHFNPVDPTGQPYTVITILRGPFHDDIGMPEAGDELGIFDDTLCVGAGIYEGRDTVVVTCWEADAGNKLLGFTPGDSIRVLYWDGSSETEYACGGNLIYGDGTFGYAPYTLYELDVATDVAVTAEMLPTSYSLAQNYPNPFNPTTQIDYSIPERSQVTITIYNILGQSIRTVLDEEKPAGRYSIVWDGKDDNGSLVSTGIYLYRLTAVDYAETKKMILMK